MKKSWFAIPALALAACGGSPGEGDAVKEGDAPKCTIDGDTSYLIVTRDKFKDALVPFVEHKEATETVDLVTVDDLMQCDFRDQNSEDDSPVTVTQHVRSAIRAFSNLTPNLKNVLIVGRPYPVIRYDKNSEASYPAVYASTLRSDYEVPIQYFPSLTRESVYNEDGRTTHNLTASDQYYAAPDADFADSYNVDTDMGIDALAASPDFARYIEAYEKSALSYDFSHSLHVGRVPARTVGELQNWIRNATSFKAADVPVHSVFKDAPCFRAPGDRAPDSLSLKMAEGTHEIKFHVCKNEDGGDIAGLSNADGANLVSFFGHGLYGKMGQKYTLKSENVNFETAPLVYAHACYAGSMHVDDLSVGEQMVVAENGASGLIAHSTLMHDIRFPFYESVFFDGRLHTGEAVFDTKQSLADSAYLSKEQRDNFMALNILGDPGLKIHEPKVTLNAAHTTQYDEAAGTFMFSGTVNSGLDKGINTFFLPEEGAGGAPEEFFLGAGESKSFSRVLEPPFVVFYGNDALFGERSRGKSSYTYYGAVKCDTSSHSCQGSKVEVYPTVAYKCGNFRKMESGSYGIDVEFLNSHEGEMEFIFYASRGMRIPKSQSHFEPEKVIVYSSLTGGMKAGEHRTYEFPIDNPFNDAPLSEAEEDEYFYFPPTYFTTFKLPDSVEFPSSTCALSVNLTDDPTL